MSKRLKRRLSNDKKGITGMPLKLMIMVLIAAAAIAVLFVWMPSSDEGKLDKVKIELKDSPSGSYSEISSMKKSSSNQRTIRVTAISSNDEAMKDIAINMTGCGVKDETIMTDSDGQASFTIDSDEIDFTGKITFTAEDPDTSTEISKSVVVK